MHAKTLVLMVILATAGYAAALDSHGSINVAVTGENGLCVNNTVTINVTAERTGRALGGADVDGYFNNKKVFELKTEDDGVASFTPTAQGDYRIEIEKSGYRDTVKTVSVLSCVVETTTTSTSSTTSTTTVPATTTIPECVLSLCDCKCHLKGTTPEDIDGRLCGINCMGEFNISNCEYADGKCVEIYVTTTTVTETTTVETTTLTKTTTEVLTTPEEPEKQGIGGFAIILVIVIVLVAAAYLLTQKKEGGEKKKSIVDVHKEKSKNKPTKLEKA